MSHTMMVVLGGLAMLAAMIAIGRPSRAQAAKRFIPLWAVLSLVNMFVGVFRAGYGLMDEAGVLVIVFGLPAAVALLASRQLKA